MCIHTYRQRNDKQKAAAAAKQSKNASKHSQIYHEKFVKTNEMFGRITRITRECV